MVPHIFHYVLCTFYYSADYCSSSYLLGRAHDHVMCIFLSYVQFLLRGFSLYIINFSLGDSYFALRVTLCGF